MNSNAIVCIIFFIYLFICNLLEFLFILWGMSGIMYSKGDGIWYIRERSDRSERSWNIGGFLSRNSNLCFHIKSLDCTRVLRNFSKAYIVQHLINTMGKKEKIITKEISVSLHRKNNLEMFLENNGQRVTQTQCPGKFWSTHDQNR